jgi:hypothetical protein
LDVCDLWALLENSDLANNLSKIRRSIAIRVKFKYINFCNDFCFVQSVEATIRIHIILFLSNIILVQLLFCYNISCTHCIFYFKWIHQTDFANLKTCLQSLTLTILFYLYYLLIFHTLMNVILKVFVFLILSLILMPYSLLVML